MCTDFNAIVLSYAMPSTRAKDYYDNKSETMYCTYLHNDPN